MSKIKCTFKNYGYDGELTEMCVSEYVIHRTNEEGSGVMESLIAQAESNQKAIALLVEVLVSKNIFNAKDVSALVPGWKSDNLSIDSTAKCPWPDYAGNELFDGDIIKHPDGESGIIEYRPDESTIHRQWGVNYGDNSVALLCLQIGDKGKAVKVV